jgi:ABC-type bacteriocin/lantibiotic exporter with double-glycine peptidase domain
MKGFAATTYNQDRLYDCAANSLYLFCSLTNNKISYDKSIELLPMTDKGNSMLAVNNALQKCGFETKAKTIKSEDIVKVKSPSIVLNYPENSGDVLFISRRSGATQGQGRFTADVYIIAEPALHRV